MIPVLVSPLNLVKLMQCNVKIRSTVLLCCMSASADLTGRGRGGREARPTGLSEGGEQIKKIKKNQPNYPGELLFCSLLPVRLMNVKCCNLRVLIVTEKRR